MKFFLFNLITEEKCVSYQLLLIIENICLGHHPKFQISQVTPSRYRLIGFVWGIRSVFVASFKF